MYNLKKKKKAHKQEKDCNLKEYLMTYLNIHSSWLSLKILNEYERMCTHTMCLTNHV